MKAWGGRFQKETAALMDDFHSSIHFDRHLATEDLEGSIAHAKMLGAVGIITPAEAATIIDGLKQIQIKIGQPGFVWDVTAEDIHLNIEKLLIEEIGEVGKKLHTARSRNDQVALDVRLYLRKEIGAIQKLLRQLVAALVAGATRERETIMPGYTHLQRAQPVLLAHHLLAYFEMFRRDFERLTDCGRRVDVSPLGSGALAGAGFPIDRQAVAAELGMKAVAANSMDAVGDRDFVAEFIFASSLIMMHLSRFCEELVLWASMEFGFIEMDDAYSTGSSIMPQKKNPDVVELVRGKTGRVYGDLVTILTVMKSLPLAYNKDMQEDKEPLFDAVQTVKGCLRIFIPMFETLTFNRARMLAATKDGFLNATDLADYLAGKGMPFREAHAVTGRLVKYCLDHQKRLEELTLDELQTASTLIAADVYAALDMKNVVKARSSYGGTSFEQVRRQLDRANAWLAAVDSQS
jgi:argininosuccinate lyase